MERGVHSLHPHTAANDLSGRVLCALQSAEVLRNHPQMTMCLQADHCADRMRVYEGGGA